MSRTELVGWAKSAAGPLLRRFVLTVPPSASGVHHARHVFRALLHGWDEAPAAAAESAFAEVAANAFRHGRGRITVRVCLAPDWVRCDVRDGNWRFLRGRYQQYWHPRYERCWPGESGRGMVIVTALADRWGVRRRPLGKTVWFEVGSGNTSARECGY
ncbi:MAG TPA: ATP-binding protein [Streptosporangiaceae bacterium]|nr:ATP-binding protein [Streptosporangiaceae bacterium]